LPALLKRSVDGVAPLRTKAALNCGAEVPPPSYISADPQPIGLDTFIIVISCPALEIGKAGGKAVNLKLTFRLDVSKRKSSAYRRRSGLMQKVLTATSTFIFTANLAVTAGMRSQPNSGASSQPALNGSCVTAYHQITLTRVCEPPALFAPS
jgi:hypothetical protein